MSYEVLNIISWLKFQEADGLDFLTHVSYLKRDGVEYGIADLYKLAQQYGFDTQAESTIEMCWQAYKMKFDE